MTKDQAFEIMVRESDPSEPEMWRSLANGSRSTIPLTVIVALEAYGLVERLRHEGNLVMNGDARGQARLTTAGWSDALPHSNPGDRLGPGRDC